MPADLAELDRIARRIWDERSDLHATFGDVGSIGFWFWLMGEGTEQHPEILAALPAPDRSLRLRVNHPDQGIFLGSAVSDAQNLFAHLARAGLDPARRLRLLDFGCGCGRLLRVAARFRETCELFGADVDEVSLAWCRLNLGFASFERVSPQPPSPYADASFDAIWSYSIFTHLPEKLHRAWLEDLHRILKPGACMVVTTAGRRVVERFLERDVVEALKQPTPDDLRAELATFDSGGYVFFPIGQNSLIDAEDEHGDSTYGMTFFDERYVRERWLDLFELVAFDPAPQDWQDYVVLRRRG